MPQLSSPRRLAFRGHIEAVAWGFPRSLIPPDALPERVLALWQSGARLEEFDWGHVLFLPTPQKVRAELAPALVFTRYKNSMVAAPPPRGNEPTEGIWVVDDGQWQALQNGRVVDVSLWLDVGTWTVPPTVVLGEVPEVPVAITPIALDLRAQSGIAPPDQKWQTIWERGSGTPSSFPLPNFSPSLLFGFLSALFTPKRDAGDVPLASDRSIAISGVVALLGASLFMLRAWSSPSTQGALPVAFFIGLLFFGVARFLMTKWGKDSLSRQSQTAPPFVISPGIQKISFALIGLGLLRIALADVSRAISTLFALLVAIGLLRLVGGIGTLIGQSAVGVGGNGGTGAGSRGESWLTRWFRRASSGAGTGAPNPKTRDNAGDLWRRLMANAALKSGLFKTLGRAQARYLLRSMELFERGDLEAALRHAIPLGGKSDGLWAPPPALGLPGMRPDLNISLANMPARGTLNFGPEIEERLRTLYRRAFEKLRDAGEIHKAAFVLADLLQNAEEAVAFLEEHRELELAAKLAEGRGLAPGLVVRTWWLAGNRARAVQIAQLKEAFADAVVRLEKSPAHSADAATLRLLWGHHLANLGRFDAAVEAVWPLPQGRPFASKWLRLGLEQNTSPRLLARALALEPDHWDEWRPLLETLLHGEHNANGTRRRAQFARELDSHKGENNPALSVAARMTARALLRDGTGEGTNIEQSVWTNLLSLSGDGLLRADSSYPAPLRNPAALSKRDAPLEISITSEGGTLNARDAVLLESGELLVALGEMGARLLSWDGRIKAQFDVPAHTIVSAFDAPRALLLAPRDDIWRVTKLDINRRKATLWGDVRARCFARHFDGATWFVGGEGRVRALDVASPTPSALWDSGDMNGQPLELAISRNSLAALVERAAAPNSFLPGASTNATFESWQFESPALVLRSRRTPTFSESPHAQRRIHDTGEQFAVALGDDPSEPLTHSRLYFLREGQQIIIAHKVQQVLEAVAGKDHTAHLWHDGQSALASLFWHTGKKVLAHIRFEGATHVGGHECGSFWVFWDDQGRVLAFNTATGTIEREWILA